MALIDYNDCKFKIAEVLHAAGGFCADEQRGLKSRSRQLLLRLAEDRFNLVVAGRFNRGKSSVMNAILRCDSLPTGILPLTSVVTSVGYGNDETVFLTFDEGEFGEEMGLDSLPDFIT